MTTTLAEFERLLVAPRETEHLEFKEAKTQYDTNKLFRYCVALANEGGGKMILGVSDRPPRRVVGSQAFLNTDDIASKIREKVGFRVDVGELAHADGRVVIFDVPSRPRGTAFQLDGAYWMRSTEDLVPMTEDRLRKIFDEGKAEWSYEPALTEVDADEVVRLLDTQSYFDLLEQPYPSNRDAVLAKFAGERLIIRTGATYAITNIGALLFAKTLESFDVSLRRKAPRVVAYAGTDKLTTRVDRPNLRGYAAGFEGLIEQVNDLCPANEVIEQALRKKTQMFPEQAIRELVANALIHQDLTESGTTVMIEIYADRMEVSNPGLPLTPTDRFIDDYKSRNEAMADLMRRLGVCEEKGSGVDKVISAAEVYQLPAPDFRVSMRRTTAVLFAHKEFSAMDRDERVRAAYQHCCLKYVMNQKMTNQSLRERFKLPESKAETISRIIRDAVDEARIKPDDPESKSKRYAQYVPWWA